MNPLEAEILTLILKGHDTRDKLAKVLPGLQKDSINRLVDSLIARGLLEQRKKGLLRRETLTVTSAGIASLQGTQQAAKGVARRRVRRGTSTSSSSTTVDHYHYYDDYPGYSRYHDRYDDYKDEDRSEDKEDEEDKESIWSKIKEEAEEVVDEVEEAIEDVVDDEPDDDED